MGGYNEKVPIYLFIYLMILRALRKTSDILHPTADCSMYNLRKNHVIIYIDLLQVLNKNFEPQQRLIIIRSQTK